MSEKTKTTKTSKGSAAQFVRDLPGNKKVKLPLDIDLEEMFTLVEAVHAIDDDADAHQTLLAVRAIMPEDFLSQVKGVPVGVSLPIFMEWINEMTGQLGKALTTPVA